ncbi:RES family NAD+ phosphorylase [Mycobacterium sp. CPCC 205372]|uniref:RES family NAD+ phosphorylase n=1 Tax=Mycobacterium hippophais TaxID=3016340 RepID=A0ABT4PPN9_9MYCO|nr:RES family NAD+ phosphorylase [Mycobacterium hippophais]MCZ8378456.1 RES family NAD+ phosphorylase [Mycobacterium hippophais]
MVADLGEPHRPLRGGRIWTWRWPTTLPRAGWGWCRVYHRSAHTPDGITHRGYGPLARLDHHTPPPDAPAMCPDGRTVLYVAGNLSTALGEVFGDLGEAAICPGYRVALVRPRAEVITLDLRSEGAAMRIGALPSLATGAYPRPHTQRWARAIYEDQPARRPVDGVYYHAAHSNGRALALWNTDADVETVASPSGEDQDFALGDPRMWRRVVVAAGDLGMTAARIDACPRCGS